LPYLRGPSRCFAFFAVKRLFVLSVLSEFELIARYFTPPTTHTVLAGGDDAALVRVAPGMDLVVSTDMLVGGRHFFDDADPYGVGHKSLAVNLSDLAAMGATPRWATLSIALPAADEAWVAPFADGFLRLARLFDVDLIGGDTTRGPLNICVQIMGEVPAGTALRRDGARVGDEVWVSGTLGDAALAVAHRRGEFELHAQELEHAKERLDFPQPRVALGLALRGVAHALIDLSDGLVADLGHICERSGVAAVVEWAAVPKTMVAARSGEHAMVRQCVLAGGDDYELCFTAPTSRTRQVLDAASAAGVSAARIGVTVVDAAGRAIVLERGGYDHFR
jgi:thiamine-monophosphate kinase